MVFSKIEMQKTLLLLNSKYLKFPRQFFLGRRHFLNKTPKETSEYLENTDLTKPKLLSEFFIDEMDGEMKDLSIKIRKLSKLQEGKKSTQSKANLNKAATNEEIMEIDKFALPKADYVNYLKQCEGGNISFLNYEGVQCYFIGANFQLLRNKNNYKILKYINPHLVSLQIRPDSVLKDFAYFPKNAHAQFDSQFYLNQLIREGDLLFFFIIH